MLTTQMPVAVHLPENAEERTEVLQGPMNTNTYLQVVNVHLTGAHLGKGRMSYQVQRIREWIDSLPENQPWILAGSFDLLPASDHPARLSLEEDTRNRSQKGYVSRANPYLGMPNPLEILYEHYQEAFQDSEDPAPYTYKPSDLLAADRKIDHVFHGGPVKILEATVLREFPHLSNHLPIRIEFSLFEGRNIQTADRPLQRLEQSASDNEESIPENPAPETP
jgi:endonuclease/exonuclease/phosphatase family metal-dependent hydrolase